MQNIRDLFEKGERRHVMRKTAVMTLLALAALLEGVGAAHGAENRGEEKLARALDGYVAGEPVTCIRLHDIRSTQIYDRTAILYIMTGGKRYLNRPDSGARSLRQGDLMITDTRSPDLCDIDVVKLYDAAMHMPTGFVNLGRFVPYETAKE
jgi:hypothetical protein